MAVNPTDHATLVADVKAAALVEMALHGLGSDQRRLCEAANAVEISWIFHRAQDWPWIETTDPWAAVSGSRYEGALFSTCRLHSDTSGPAAEGQPPVNRCSARSTSSATKAVIV